MPYNRNSELPKEVRNVLPAAAQSVFRSVVNSQLDDGLSEKRAFASAWGALRNQGWEKGDDGKWKKVEKQDKDGVTLYGEVSKTDEEQRLVFGWASVVTGRDGEPVVDKQGDVIRPEELEKSVYEYVHDVRLAGEMHRNADGVGQLVESVVLTPEKQAAMGLQEMEMPTGWWVGFKVSPEVFEKVKAGQYKMFSIGGGGVRSPLNAGDEDE